MSERFAVNDQLNGTGSFRFASRFIVSVDGFQRQNGGLGGAETAGFTAFEQPFHGGFHAIRVFLAKAQPGDDRERSGFDIPGGAAGIGDRLFAVRHHAVLVNRGAKFCGERFGTGQVFGQIQDIGGESDQVIVVAGHGACFDLGDFPGQFSGIGPGFKKGPDDIGIGRRPGSRPKVSKAFYLLEGAFAVAAGEQPITGAVIIF